MINTGRPESPFALRAERVFDGRQLRAKPFVLIEGTQIVAVGETPPESMDVIDLGDATLLPGLIDCHQHLVFNGQGTLEEQVSDIDNAGLLERAAHNANSALLAGITTLRDLGDRAFVTLPLREDASLPTILCAGPPLTVAGGHCAYLGGECAGIEELIAAVRARADRGCDVVKIMVTGGVLSPSFPIWESQFSPEQVRAVVDESHRLGLPVAAHCHGVAGIVSALDADVDSIEHCTFANSAGVCEPVPSVLERLAVSDVGISTTLGRLPGHPIPALLEENLDVLNRARQELHQRGATLVVGTDAGITPAKPHNVLPYALGELLDTGMTSVEGLAALTSVAAKVCGVAHGKGLLAPGFDADLLAVAGDPLTDTDALRAVTGVWKAGRQLVGAGPA